MLATLLRDFEEENGRPPLVIVIQPNDWGDLFGWHRMSAFIPADKVGMTVRDIPVRTSRDVAQSRPELY